MRFLHLSQSDILLQSLAPKVKFSFRERKNSDLWVEMEHTLKLSLTTETFGGSGTFGMADSEPAALFLKGQVT